MKTSLVLWVCFVALCASVRADCFNQSTPVQDDRIGSQFVDVFECSLVDAKSSDSIDGLYDLGFFLGIVFFLVLPLCVILFLFGLWVYRMVFS